MNKKYIHIYNKLINYTRNKDLYKGLNREDNSTYAAIFGRGGNDISPITVPATNDSKWHNVIITYTGSTLALYIDGSNITLPSQPSSYATTLESKPPLRKTPIFL